MHISGSSHSDKEVDALTPEKSAAMRGSTAGPGVVLVPPSGATPTITIPDRKRKRKGEHLNLCSYLFCSDESLTVGLGPCKPTPI